MKIKEKVLLITDKENLSNIYTLINKNWDYISKEDGEKLKSYFRDIIIENLKEAEKWQYLKKYRKDVLSVEGF